MVLSYWITILIKLHLISDRTLPFQACNSVRLLAFLYLDFYALAHSVGHLHFFSRQSSDTCGSFCGFSQPLIVQQCIAVFPEKNSYISKALSDLVKLQ